MIKIKFTNPKNGKLLTSYEGFQDIDEVNETVNLLKYSENLEIIEVEFLKNNRLIRRLTYDKINA